MHSRKSQIYDLRDHNIDALRYSKIYSLKQILPNFLFQTRTEIFGKKFVELGQAKEIRHVLLMNAITKVTLQKCLLIST